MSGRRPARQPLPCDPYIILSSKEWDAKNYARPSPSGISNEGCAPTPSPTAVASASASNDVNPALDALFILGQQRDWTPSFLSLGDLCRATRGEEALWGALAAVPRGPFGRTSLMYAAFSGDVARVKFLVKCGNTLEARDFQDLRGQTRGFRGKFYGEGNRTALHWASEGGHAGCVAALVEAGADVHALDYKGSPLHVAAFWGRIGAVHALLKHGADPNDSAATALAYAHSSASASRLSSASRLTWKKRRFDFFAANEGGHEVLAGVSAALTAAADDLIAPSSYPATDAPLCGATLFGAVRIERSSAFLNHLVAGASSGRARTTPGAARTTPLLAAIEGGHEGHEDVIAALLAAGADPSAPSSFSAAEAPLFAAVRKMRNSVIPLLLTAGASTEATLGVCTSCSREHTPQNIEEVMWGAFLPPTKNPSKPTALHIAARCCNVDAVRLLLAGGASSNTRDAAGSTPLLLACSAAWLLNKRVTSVIKEEEVEKWSARTTPFPFDSIIRDLLLSGADVNATNEDGNTPLGILCSGPPSSLQVLSEDYCRRLGVATGLLLAAGASVHLQGGSPMAAESAADGGEGGGAEAAVAEDAAEGAGPEAGEEEAVESREGEAEGEEEKGAPEDISLLLHACASGSLCVARALLEAPGVRVDAPPSLLCDLFSCTLDTRCENTGCSMGSIARLVVAKGGDVNAVVKAGQPLLVRAVSFFSDGYSRIDDIRALLDCGADVNAVTDNGDTALLWATVVRSSELVQLLLDAGADPLAANDEGVTALHGAFYEAGDIGQWRPAAPIVRLLLAAGASATVAAKNGDLPLALLEMLEAEVRATPVPYTGYQTHVDAALADLGEAKKLLLGGVHKTEGPERGVGPGVGREGE